MKRWYQIKEYLNLRGVKYDSFQSDGEGSTEVLTKMLINNGYKTIVVVGGDEALNDAVNALMFTPREVRSEIVVGVIPNGIGNDFASFWGLDVENYKQAIHWIIERRVKKIDVGYCSYKEGDEEKVRYFLMSVNIGLGAQAIRLSDICKRFGKKNPSYILAIFALFKERKQYKMRIKVNNEEINDKIMKEEFDYAKAVEELEAIASKVENPETGIDDIEKCIRRSEELVEACRAYLRGAREKLDE